MKCGEDSRENKIGIFTWKITRLCAKTVKNDLIYKFSFSIGILIISAEGPFTTFRPQMNMVSNARMCQSHGTLTMEHAGYGLRTSTPESTTSAISSLMNWRTAIIVQDWRCVQLRGRMAFRGMGRDTVRIILSYYCSY